jgi:phenylacetate-CoA ligase
MFINWRKPLVFFLLKAQGSRIPGELKFVRSVEWNSSEEIREIQNQRLTRLLLHAWENTEYYRRVLSECGVVRNGTVDLDRFEDIPFLTKDILRSEGSRLKAKHLPKGRKAYVNRTGGSTGEPLEFWQDSYYNAVNVANKLYHFGMLGKETGELEMKIWGSERDHFVDTSGWFTKLRNFIYNRKIENCVRLSEQNICLIIGNINRFKPKVIWAYLGGVYAIADYANRNDLELHSPTAVAVGATTLYPHMEEAIEKAFHSCVINYYGSREMGAVACQCKEKAGLHITSHSHRVETIDKNCKSVFEEDGNIVVTSLTNYAMPFIRYWIGDRGRLTDKKCPCGRGFPLLESVSGRSLETFINSKGEYVSPVSLISTIGYTFLDPGFVKKFQLVQDDYSYITVKTILEPGISREEIQPDLDNISKKIQLVMGEECIVSYDFVDRIPLTKSGKYLYTVCNIPNKNTLVQGVTKGGVEP